MQKKFTENPIMFEVLAAYKKSEFSSYLSFYEYCQVTMQMNQMTEMSDLVDQLRIEHSMRENFHPENLGGLDNEEGEL